MLINGHLILYVISFKSLTSWLNKRFNPSVNSHDIDLIPVNNAGIKKLVTVLWNRLALNLKKHMDKWIE